MILQGTEPEEHWEVTVFSVNPDAWDVILAENQFNDPPEDGHLFFMANMRLKYLGPDSTLPFSHITLKTVGDAGVAYSTFDPGCGVIPDELDSFRELFTNGQIEGNVCWQIASTDADSLMLLVDLGLFNSVRFWFSLS